MNRRFGSAATWGMLFLFLVIAGNGVLSYRNLKAFADSAAITETERENASASYQSALISLINSTAASLVLLGAVYYLMHRDAVERARSESLLRAGESRFRRLVDSNVIGVLFADFEGHITDANDSFLNMVGYSRTELQAGELNWRALTPAEFIDADRRAIDELKATGIATPYEKQYLHKNGKPVSFLLGCAALEEPKGMCICYAIDLTERKQTQEIIQRLNNDLQDRVHELETLFEVMPIGVGLAKDRECQMITVNGELARALGVPGGSHVSLATSGDERPSFQAFRGGRAVAPGDLPMQKTAATGEAVLDKELEIVRKDGSRVKLLESVAPLFDEEGLPRGSIGAFVDITERTRLDDALRAHAQHLQNQQHWLEAVLNLLPTPLLLIEPGTARITFANRAAHQMAGGSFPLGEPAEHYDRVYKCTSLAGKLLTNDEMPGVRVARGEQLNDEQLNWHVGDQVHALMINADTLPPIHGHDSAAILMFQEISQLKQIEAELRRNNQSKDALLAMLGHELRNPLAAITGASELIARCDRDDPVWSESLQILERHIEHLTRMIDDMLDLTRLTTGKVKLRSEIIELSQPLAHAIQAAQAIIDTRGHQLILNHDGKPIPLDADRSRLEQVFTNLIVNAAKYTEPGGVIEVTSSCADGFAIVRIKDTGIGLDPKALPTLFDLFAQVNPSLDRSEAGLGIGLTVVRSLVELHHGEVSAHSEGVGRGSEFVVRLPLATPEQTEQARGRREPEIAASPMRKLRVLIVEDHPDIARVMQALVARCGHDPLLASNAAEALQLIADARPQVAFVDIGLPGMNGFELAQQVRAENPNNEIVLIALTGYGQQEDRIRSEAVGFARHIVKPVSFDSLKSVLDEYASELVSETG